MTAHFHDETNDVYQVCSLTQLPSDLRRALVVQFKEFIHYIEDAQPENELAHTPRVLAFLERCLADAA